MQRSWPLEDPNLEWLSTLLLRQGPLLCQGMSDSRYLFSVQSRKKREELAWGSHKQHLGLEIQLTWPIQTSMTFFYEKNADFLVWKMSSFPMVSNCPGEEISLSEAASVLSQGKGCPAGQGTRAALPAPFHVFFLTVDLKSVPNTPSYWSRYLDMIWYDLIWFDMICV